MNPILKKKNRCLLNIKIAKLSYIFTTNTDTLKITFLKSLATKLYKIHLLNSSMLDLHYSCLQEPFNKSTK